MDELITKLKSIPFNSKITLTVKGWPGTAELQAKLIEHPRFEDDQWIMKIRYKWQKRNDVFHVGGNLLDVREGWDREG